MNKPVSVSEILEHSDIKDLHQFIIDYAGKDAEFRQAFNAKFNPSKISTSDKKSYAAMVSAAFKNNPLTTRCRYRNWNDYGFDPEGVREDLQLLLDKVAWFIQSENFDEAILICQAMIEIIPDEWEDQFDRDGDVQVMYDGAIDRLQEMLDRNALSKNQKENLFDWYHRESRDNKHEYVGLNTSLIVLENYFMDTPEMLQKSLANIEGRSNSADSDYKRAEAAVDKINFLKNADLEKEAENAITQYVDFEEVRRMRLGKLMDEKNYTGAIELIQEGINVATKEKHSGTVTSWKEDLISIYTKQRNTGKVISLAEELFYENRNRDRKYYKILKQYTSWKDWPATMERLLGGMDKGYFGFNSLKADILIEHKMWERLFELCKNAGAEKLEEYEKHLKPLYAGEILNAYHQYVEKQATITDPKAYMDVARGAQKNEKVRWRKRSGGAVGKEV